MPCKHLRGAWEGPQATSGSLAEKQKIHIWCLALTVEFAARLSTIALAAEWLEGLADFHVGACETA